MCPGVINQYIERWLWPDIIRNQNTSIAKAKKAVADYKKATGTTEGLAELSVYYCECAAGFSNEVGLQDEGYFDALVRMFEQALKKINELTSEHQPAFTHRLSAVKHACDYFGYGVADDMDYLLSDYGVNS